MRKISTWLSTLLITIYSIQAFATAGYVFPPVGNTTAQPVAGQDPSGRARPIQVDTLGDLILSSVSPAVVSLIGNNADLDSGAGVDNHNIVAVGLPGNGGAVVGGTSTNPLRVDPTGTTPQPVSESGAWDITNISGAISLPTGASTSALQTTGNTSLSSLDGKTATLGQKTMAGSEPVVIASDQSAVPVSAASLPLPAGAATAALQTTGNASTSSIDTKLSSQATAANQSTQIASLASIDNKLTSPIAVFEVSVATNNFNTTITLAGATNRTQLASNVVQQCLFQAPLLNAGIVYAGGVTVTNASGANEGLALIQGSVLGPIPMLNTNEMYFSADNANDKIKAFCK